MVNIFISLVMVISFSQSTFSGETIYAKEIEGYFYADGKMKHSEGPFEITYFLKGDKITRTRVYDSKKKEVIPDNTIYHIQRQLWSDPQVNLSPGKKRVIRAVGQPGTDAIEILTIQVDGDFIQSVKSTADYFVISRYRRVK